MSLATHPTHPALRAILHAALAIAWLAAPSLGQAVQEAKLVGFTSTDDFGHSVSLSGDWAAVSADEEEEVYLFRRSGSNWLFDQRIQNPGFTGNEFGFSVALSGQALVVGAPRGSGVAQTTGLVYAYRYDGANWLLEATIAQADGDTNDSFGRSVSIDGDVFIASALGHRIAGVLLGAVYIYRYEPIATTWDLEQKIVGPPFDVSVGVTHYGAPVAIRNGVAVVGAITANSSTAPGRAFIYGNTGGGWVESAMVIGSQTAGDGRFGDAVATDGEVVVIGDPEHAGGALDSGAVYVFRGPGWAEEAILLPPNPTPIGVFGRDGRVAVDAGVIVVGNERAEDCITGTFSGSAFVYRQIGTGWDLEDVLCSNDLAPSDFFGWSASVSGGRVLVGAIAESFRGAAYAFLLDEVHPIEGRVVMGNAGVPLRDVEISAIEGIDVVETTTTDADGTYRMGLRAGTYTIRAGLTYQDPATGAPRTVHNYPEWRPLRKWLHSDEGPTKIAPILYPDPVLMQGGLYGGLATWDTAQTALARDPRTDAFKIQDRIPGFVTYAVPNQDEHIHGYDNSFPFTTAQHGANAEVLRNWAVLEADADLLGFVPEPSIADLRYSVVAHSMGGLITRSLTSQGFFPRIRAVVSLDGVHGGTSVAPPGSGFGEAELNGTESTAIPSSFQPGWNSFHTELDGDPPYLSYSAVKTPPLCLFIGGIVDPDASAFGIGRVMEAALPGLPTGTSLRFVNGLQVAVDETHSSTHETEERLREVMRYLTYGTRPPGALLPSEGVPDLGCSPFLPAAGVPTGTWSGSLAAAAGTTTDLAVDFDGNDLVTVELLLEGAGAQYAFLDDTGIPLAPLVLQSESIEGNAVLELLELSMPPSEEITFELGAAPGEPAEARLTLRFSNGRRLLASAASTLLDAGVPVPLTARFEDALGTVLTGSSPTVVATVTLPSGSTSALALLDDGLHGDGAAGDGVFGETFAGTAEEGRYGVRIEGSTTLAGEILERTATVLFSVSPTGAAFVGSPAEELPDDDMDRLADALVLRWPIDFTEDGEWVVTAELQDGTGERIAEIRETVVHAGGASPVDVLLSISAEQLAEHGADGPWHLVGPTIASADHGLLIADTAPDHQTQAYSLADFEAPPPQEVVQVLPSELPRAGSGSTVHLLGQHLSGVTEVRVGEAAATFLVLSDSSIEVSVPALPPAGGAPAAGSTRIAPVSLDVTVTTPWHVLVLEDALSYRMSPAPSAPR